MKKILSVFLFFIVPLSYSADYSGKKVLYIDSYHQGFSWSDGIGAGVHEILDGSGVELKVHYMDTKRNTSDEFKKQAALDAKALIESFKPDVVIACDDNASKFLIQPYYKDADLPFVFCGVNWDETTYGYPYSNVTGMVEVSGSVELFDLLGQFTSGQRLGILFEDNISDRKITGHLKTKLGLTIHEERFASSVDGWKEAYVELQDKVDMLIVSIIGGIDGFDVNDISDFVIGKTKIPTGTIGLDAIGYSMIGYLKVASEQGRWASKAALQILDGKKAGDIPITRNKEGVLYINAKIAESLGAEIPFELIEAADQVIE